jgi:hypothetical protein
MPRVNLKPLIRIGSVVGFVALLMLYFVWSMRVPPPREGDRVTHRDGAYSIIKPRDWDAEFNYAGDARYQDTLEVRFTTRRPRDLRIFVGRMRNEPKLEEIQARDKPAGTEFQGRPAHVFTGRTRLEHYWRAIFQRGGEWYELVFWMPYEQDVKETGYWPYLESFRASEAPTTTTTTTSTSPT